MRALAVAAAALVLAGPAQGHHQTALVNDTPPPTPCGRPAEPTCPKAVAFLVNGFGGCCVSPFVAAQLAQRFGAVVHESNWNDILQDGGATVEPNGHPGCFSLSNPFGCGPSPRPYSDEAFIGQMQAAIGSIADPDTKIVLVGHSFGADSLLQLVHRIGGRRVDFLGVLDAVGSGGLRANVTSWAQGPSPTPVPQTVEYLFNRWQHLVPFPLENPLPSLSGRVASGAAASDQSEQSFKRDDRCNTRYSLFVVPQILSHQGLPNDPCVRTRLVRALESRVFNPYPRVVRAAPVFGSSVIELVGVRLVFSVAIDASTFTVADVLAAPSVVTGVNAVPGTGGREFVVRFAPVSVLRGPGAPTRHLTVGPDVLDVDNIADAADHKPMDQNANLNPGEPVRDRFTFTYPPPDRPLEVEPPAVVDVKTIVGLHQRVRRIVALALTFDRQVARAVATDTGLFRLVVDGQRVPIATATYAAAPRRVTLVPASPLAADRQVQVLVLGGPGMASFAGLAGR